MSVIAMKITKAEPHPHPKAKKLRFYEAVAGDVTALFTANLTNVYEVGDTVAVAQVGSVVPDGEGGLLKIEQRNVMGTDSFGMGMGKTERPVGCNLDSLYPWPHGTRVRTFESYPPTSGWSLEAKISRQFGVTGKVVSASSGHGFCYGVLHDNDESIGFYEPQELVVL